MYESSVQTTIVGADGTTIVCNDGASGVVLEEISGFDSPNIRLNIEDLPEEDSAVAGDSWLGQRPVTMRGKVGVGLTAANRNAVVVNLQRALRGLRADVTLEQTPSGLPAMQIAARVQSLRVTGGFVKDWLATLVCADPRIYSQALNSWSGTKSGTPAAPGASFPLAFDINFGGGGGAYAVALNVSNAGNIDTPLLLHVDGPISNPQLTNPGSGESIYVDGIDLAGGEWLEIDTTPGARSVLKNDGSNWYANVRYPGSIWMKLLPGASTIQLWGTNTTGSTGLTVKARDAWA